MKPSGERAKRREGMYRGIRSSREEDERVVTWDLTDRRDEAGGSTLVIIFVTYVAC
jgi:hypothetical protein